MTTLQQVELGVLGPLQVRQYGLPVSIPGAKPRAILTMLGLHGGSIVSAETLLELLWGDDPPRTAGKALQTHISSLRRALGDGFVLTEGTGWIVSTTDIDALRYKSAVKQGRDAMSTSGASQAVAHFEEALTSWRDAPELPDSPRGLAEKTRWIEGHASLIEDRADALLATDRAAEIIGELEAAIADAPLRERRWGQLMLALYRAGRQGEALGAYQRARTLLAEELGVDPGPDLRKLEAAIVAQDDALEVTVSQQLPTITRAVTFLLTDIEGSTAAWEADAGAMAVALARHDELVEQVVTTRGGRLVKTRGEGDATFSVFDRPSAGATAAIELQEAIRHEPWALRDPMRIRVALHTGEVEFRDGDYFGRAVNRAARLRSLAAGGQILCSGATAELVIDTLPDDVLLADLGTRQLKNLARPEHVFELRLETADDARAPTVDAPIQRPDLPAVLGGLGPFVGRIPELERLLSAWQTALSTGTHAVLIAGEPGVGKTRLAGEWTRQAYELGAVVLYGRCDEDLGAPYQPFAEALRMLVPCLGSDRLRGVRGIEALLPLIPSLTDVLPDLIKPTHADAESERYALFDAVVALLGAVGANAPVVLILDDLHWAAKPTLLLLRHLLRFGDHVSLQIIGTYRSTDLDRTHPLAAMLADLHRDGSADRLSLTGLDEDDVTAYVCEAGYDDEELARALASVTGGNPFFLIEALRHVDESGGRWDPTTLPQGVREAVSRRLSRLSEETSIALAAAAVVGSRFALDLVERVTGDDLMDAFDEARRAGIVIEEPGGLYRFNHALVRQSLLAELASVRRMRLHQRIAVTLEAEPRADDEQLAELAYHYFECAWAGNAAKAVEYCRRAADQAMARLAYEGAADLYDRALHALEDLDDELPDRDNQQAELMIARLEALLAAGDVVTAVSAVAKLQAATRDSARLAAWGTCFDGQLSMLTNPERLDEIEAAVSAAAEKLAGLDDPAGEAKAHTVRAGCLARLGRIGDCETALDQALTAARRAHEHRRVNNVLANAPLAALWGPNPVPRAGGRCLDVVRLLRITTGSPVVEATSTRCQGVLDAFRGRAAAGRRLIDSARRSLTELGMRHALLEVEQFAGIVELVADDPAAAEPHLRKAYDGFRRMGLDADTAETAVLLARACLALDRDDEADELCTESERLAGHALKASMGWRTVRAQLLARIGDHTEAKRVAQEAVTIAGGTDALVDHGDACLALATVLNAAGDHAGARAAAERAVELYELKGAAALAEKARRLLGEETMSVTPAAPEAPQVELVNECMRVALRAEALINREALDEAEQLWASDVVLESHRKIVRFSAADLPPGEWYARRVLQVGGVRVSQVVIAIRGERLALTRTAIRTTDVSPGAPSDEFLRVFGINQEGRIALEVWFDVEDIDAAMAELDAAYRRLEQHPRRAPVENAASRAEHYLNALFADRCWDEIAAQLVDDIQVEERRRGFRRESDIRAELMSEVHVVADLGVKNITSTPVAVRGERLVLSLTRFHGRTQRPDTFQTEVLRLAEIDNDERFVAFITFDTDDVDAAIAELDARYLAGEAAPYEDRWQACIDMLGELNRHERGPVLGGLTYTDHRRIPFAAGDYGRAIEDLWTLVPDARYRMPAVYRLDAQCCVLSLVIEGTDANGSALQWVRIAAWDFERGRADVYDEDDLDAALARFEERPLEPPRLENAASRVYARFHAASSARDLDALAAAMTEDFALDDRRRVVNAGIRHGRDTNLENLRTIADMGSVNVAWTVVATRGEHLVLTRNRWTAEQAAVHVDSLCVIEIDSAERIAAEVILDSDDVDAAFEELDARYASGEAAAYAHTWSVVTQAYAALNRRELFATTPDWINSDHRRTIAFEPGEMISWVHASWDITPDINLHVEAVHRLTNSGAVVVHTVNATSQQGFNAEWRVVAIITIDGDLINRTELYDEEDLEAAIARCDELSQPARQLENAASRVYARFRAAFSAQDWEALAAAMTEDGALDDRRRVVNAGIRHGRDTNLEDMRAIADLGGGNEVWTVIATRGEHLVLTRDRWTIGDGPEAFHVDSLRIIEIDSDERLTAEVVFDTEHVDTAFAELDGRYLAGEAAAHQHTWSLIARTYAAVNRHQLPPMTPDHVSLDHHRASFAPGDLVANLRAAWDQVPDATFRVESVHRLSDLGAVVTHEARGTSREGFEAEWREIHLMTIEGDLFNRSEMFAEADLDAALVEFEKLHHPAPRLDNAASQAFGRYLACFGAREWNGMANLLAADVSTDDRRRVVNQGARQGRDAELASMQSLAELSTEDDNLTSTPIAIRGERLVLSRIRSSAYDVEVLNVIESDADGRIATVIGFDPGDLDAAFAELDARYLAGEAAVHSHTWSLIARAYASLNRRETHPTTPHFVNIDHRHGAPFAPGEGEAYFFASWDLVADLHVYIEAVHRLSDLGAMITRVGKGTSRDGFEAEWRGVDVITVEADLIERVELFDEVDIDAAITRFEELNRPAPQHQNAASRIRARLVDATNRRDLDGMLDLTTADVLYEDRRKGLRDDCAGQQQMRRVAAALLEMHTNLLLDTEPVAIRGSRLALTHDTSYDSTDSNRTIVNDCLTITEVEGDLICRTVLFDSDDIDAAFVELEQRYIDGEAAVHALTWSVVTQAFVALNRHELPTTAPDWVNIDHQRVTTVAPGDFIANIRASWDVAPDLRIYIEEVHRLSDLGAVITHAAHGTSQEGFDAEWRSINVMTVDGEQITRCELYDEADLDTALARFDELKRPTPRLENAASRIDARYRACFAARDWDAMSETIADGLLTDDRRRVVGTGARQGRDAAIVHAQTTAGVGVQNISSTIIATRGDRLMLRRARFSGRDHGPEAFHTETLGIIEVNAENEIIAAIQFDVDDLDAAIAELEKRYVSGEAAGHVRTWSVVTEAVAAANRGEVVATTPDVVNTDHRQLGMIESGKLISFLRESFGDHATIRNYAEAVHRLTDVGAVVTHVAAGTSHEGFDAEWRMVVLIGVDAGLISRAEYFDETDIDAALARFEELSRSD